ncbi:M20/M25/M40 family metallo-hydrolase [bacterium NHP-B]|nr:M20/M25/M40 family metallo-hydrolase [bacterium NHP-B]
MNLLTTLAQQLIRAQSITPDPAETFDIIGTFLKNKGFTLTFQRYKSVTNMWAYKDFLSQNPKVKHNTKHLMFLGHVDVVPPGPSQGWTHPPFGGEIHDQVLWGRGAVDMKGALAAFLAALDTYEPAFGTLSLLLTSDEEGPACHGIKKMVPWMTTHAADRFPPDLCLVGEPTSDAFIGDSLKIGRRGSLTGTLTIRGKSAHIAYPEKGVNPLPSLLAALHHLHRTLPQRLEASASLPSAPAMVAASAQTHGEKPATPGNTCYLDEGYGPFAPSHLTLTGLESDTCVMNMPPAEGTAHFGIRFNPHHQGATLEEHIRDIVSQVLSQDYDLSLSLHGEADLVRDEKAISLLSHAITKITHKDPKLITNGGTSDGRFFANLCPAIELGLKCDTMHQINERVPLEDLATLSALYTSVLSSFFDNEVASSNTATAFSSS